MGVSMDDLNGVMVVGFHGGIQAGRYPRLIVKVPRADGSIYDRQIDVEAYSRGTGEPTEVGLQLQKVHPGERIAVGVFTNVLEYNAKKDDDSRGVVKGQKQRMVTFSAIWVEPLATVEAPAGRRAANAPA